MKIQNINLIVALFVFSVLVFMFSCAQPGTLTGGDKDTIPPRIKRSYPLKNGTNFEGEKVVIKFNEYFDLNQIESKFFSSPPQADKPKFKIKGKKLIISFNEPLRDSMTYTLEFGDAIKDFNEGNPIPNLKFVFSTYDVLDTLSISGKVFSSLDESPKADMYVMAYRQNRDSLPYLQLPEYISKTDSSGNFEIKNIQAKKYKFFALKDVNNNMIYDNPDEEIAFLDTLFFPTAKYELQIDTLRAGTVLRDQKTRKIIDTLQQDSVVYTHHTDFFPNNLRLRMFGEDYKPQFIVRKSRTYKGEARFVFNRNLIDDSLGIKLLTPHNPQKTILERWANSDSLIFWTADSNAYKLDSLQFEISYLEKDSADNLNPKTDTLLFEFYKKETDTLPLQIVHNIEQTFDLFQDISLLLPTPITKIDTSQIQLYQQVDTLVEDKKIQSLKIVRTTYDSLIFYFARPLVDSLKINFDEQNQNKFQLSENSKRDTFVCKITNNELAFNDTLNFNVLFDNLYFFNVVQHFEKKYSLSLTSQKIISKNRPKPNIISLVFEKPVNHKIELQPLNFNSVNNWFSVEKNHNKINLHITDSATALQDTIQFSFRTLDYVGKNGKVFLEDTITATFKWEEQKITYATRYKRHKFRLEFALKNKKSPQIEPINFTGKNWFIETAENKNTAFEYLITSKKVKSLDTVKFYVAYDYKNRYNKTIFVKDTFALPITSLKNNKNSDSTTSETITVGKPVDFQISQDSILSRKYYLSHNFIPDTSYQVKLKTGVFTDIFGNESDSLSSIFTMQSETHYGSLSLDLKNIGAIKLDSLKPPKNLISYKLDTLYAQTDSMKIDSTEIKTPTIDSTLTAGQAIIQFYDKENPEKLILQKIITSDQKIEIENLKPATYILKIIYDENKNQKWDTGNYLKHKQPERVYFSKNIGVQSGFKTEEKWIIGN